jgi:hypothetical protein
MVKIIYFGYFIDQNELPTEVRLLCVDKTRSRLVKVGMKNFDMKQYTKTRSS